MTLSCRRLAAILPASVPLLSSSWHRGPSLGKRHFDTPPPTAGQLDSWNTTGRKHRKSFKPVQTCPDPSRLSVYIDMPCVLLKFSRCLALSCSWNCKHVRWFCLAQTLIGGSHFGPSLRILKMYLEDFFVRTLLWQPPKRCVRANGF